MCEKHVRVHCQTSYKVFTKKIYVESPAKPFIELDAGRGGNTAPSQCLRKKFGDIMIDKATGEAQGQIAKRVRGFSPSVVRTRTCTTPSPKSP